MPAAAYVLAAALLWSTAGTAIKLCSIGGWQIAFARAAIAAVLLLAVDETARRRPTRRMLAVALAYAGVVTLFVLANKVTTAANAIFLQDSCPLWVLLLSVPLLGERPRRADKLAMPVYAVGISLFFVGQLAPGQLTGNLLALGSGVCFAFYIIAIRWIGERGDAATAWGNVVAAAVAAPFALAGASTTAASLTLRDVAILVFLGAVQMALAYRLFARGVRGTTAVEASLLVLIEPVLSSIWAWVIVGERPGPYALAGGAIVLGATAWRVLTPNRAPLS